MSKIKKLGKELSEMIAAGEVVERPSSIIKELIENSVDAGAKSITVEIEGGGLTYMRVTDDGCGIEREDVPTAFLRHATSKISCSGDLFDIHTLGFRGEALAAAAAVAKIDMLTKSNSESIGTHARIEGSEMISIDEAGCPQGTTIIVRDLFYNVPARLKFMKRDATEAGYIADVILHEALAKPGISFCFIKNGKRDFFSPGDGSYISALYSAYGKAYTSELTEVCAEYDGITVTGYVTKPENSRANRSMQDFYVNGRYIRSGVMCAAVEQAYHERIMKGKFPACLLFVKLNPMQVDVNVHPAKTEVKFSNEKQLFNAVYVAVRTALDNDLSRPSAAEPPEPAPEIQSVSVSAPTKSENFHIVGNDTTGTVATGANILPNKSADEKIEQPAAIPPKPAAKSGIRIDVSDEEAENMLSFGSSAPVQTASKTNSGTVFSTAVVLPKIDGDIFGQPFSENKKAEPTQPKKQCAEVPDFSDTTVQTSGISQSQSIEKPAVKPALKETEGTEPATQATLTEEPHKIIGEIFNTFIIVEVGKEILLIDKHAAHERMIFNKISQGPGSITSQTLLSPVPVSLKPSEAEQLLQNTDMLAKLGFDISEFGTGTVLVRSIPQYLDESDIVAAVTDISERLSLGKSSSPEIFTKITERLSCLSAVKAHSTDTPEERESFVSKVLQMPEVKYCPHGRPVAVRVTEQQIEKMFKRIV